MTFKNIRTKLATAITNAGLKTTDKIPSVINPPCGLLKPETGNWESTLPRVAPFPNFTLTVVIPETLSLEEAQDTLDGWIENNKIKDAVEQADLRPDANFAHVTGWRGYGDTYLEHYIGVIFDIQVR